MTDRIMFAFAGRKPTIDATHAVYPMSLLFRAGDYADKSFVMSAEEIRAAVEHFAPIGGNIEHTDFLKGRACEVRRVWADEDGTTLRGEVAVPLGLDALLTDDERKLSCEWQRDSKTLTGIALCMKPRVSDAALMSELAGGDPDGLADMLVLMAGKRHSKDDIAIIDQISTLLKQLRDTEVAEDKEEAIENEAQMSAKEHGMTTPTRMERFMAWLGGEGEAVTFAADAPKQAETPKIDATPDPEKVALMARIAVMEKERLAEKAAAFADGEIAAKRALPAERATLIAAFSDAAEDDAAHPRTVTFAVGAETKSGTRVDALAARYAARPPHVLTEELLSDTDAQALFNRTRTAKDGEMSAERRKELLSKTALGQSIVAGK